jgi:hypothetical protein
MNANIFNLVGSNYINRNIRVTTPFGEHEGVLIRVDDEGNLTIKEDDGLVLVQRKYVASIKIKDQMRV